MKLKCTLEINDDGTLAEIYYMNGLRIARMAVKGPLRRAMTDVKAGYDSGFFGVLAGIADYQYIDDKGNIIERR